MPLQQDLKATSKLYSQTGGPIKLIKQMQLQRHIRPFGFL